jgi:thiamine biosynthesis protein ThiS
VAQLLVQLNLHPDRLAVIVNGLVVRKANHDETTLVDHDTVDIITMVGGG